MQHKGSSPLKVLQQEYRVIYLMYKSAKFGLVLTVTYLHIYVEVPNVNAAIIYCFWAPTSSIKWGTNSGSRLQCLVIVST